MGPVTSQTKWPRVSKLLQKKWTPAKENANDVEGYGNGFGHNPAEDNWYPGSEVRSKGQGPNRDGWYPGSEARGESHEPTEGTWYQGSKVKYEGESVEHTWCDEPVIRVKEAPQVALSRVYGPNTTKNARNVSEPHVNICQPPENTYENTHPTEKSYENTGQTSERYGILESHQPPEGTCRNIHQPPRSSLGNFYQTPENMYRNTYQQPGSRPTYGNFHQPPEDTYGIIHPPPGRSLGNFHQSPENTHGNTYQPPESRLTYEHFHQPPEDTYGNIRQPIGNTHGNTCKQHESLDGNEFYCKRPSEPFIRQPFSSVDQKHRVNPTQKVWQPEFQNWQHPQPHGYRPQSEIDDYRPNGMPSYDDGYSNDHENDPYASIPPLPAPPLPHIPTGRWAAPTVAPPILPHTAPPPPAPPIDLFKVYRGDLSSSLGRSALEEKVKLANSVAHSVLSRDNKNSRGQKLFLKRLENSANWTKTSGVTGEGTPPPAEERNQNLASLAAPFSKQISAAESVPALMKRPPSVPNLSVTSYSNPKAHQMMQSTSSASSARPPFSLADDMTRDGGIGGQMFAKKIMRTQSQDDLRFTTNPRPANPPCKPVPSVPNLSSSYRPIKFQSASTNVLSPKVVNRSLCNPPPVPHLLGNRFKAIPGQGDGYTDL